MWVFPAVFSIISSHFAVILNDVNVEATLILASSNRVCVSVEDSYVRLLFANLYSKFNQELDSYLRCMGSVLMLATGAPLILGLAANACTSL